MRKYSVLAVAAVAVAVIMTAQPGWSDDAKPVVNPTRVLHPTAFAVTPPMRDIPTIEPGLELPPREIPNRSDIEKPLAPGKQPSDKPAIGEGAIAGSTGAYAPAPMVAFEGISNLENETLVGYRLAPPDTQGAVGLNHYIQWVNLVWAVWDKSGNMVGGPWLGNSLWQALPASSACRTSNNGDPITLYDHTADRWFMSQFALPGPYYTCLAVSQTGDPLGAWYVWEYEYSTTDMNDYPKFGVWPDGYYMTVNEYGSAESATTVFDRTAMLAGNPSPAAQYFYIEGMQPAFPLPTNFGSGDPPPAGSPNYNAAFYDDSWGNPYDILHICEFHVDWATPANSTFACPPSAGVEIDLTSAGLPFDSDLCGYSRDCIQQPGTTQRVDALSNRFMYPLQYRNLLSTLGYEVMVVSHSVDVDGADRAGVRWYELRNTGTGWYVHDGGTFAPATDSDSRWMGSADVDSMGNIAIGYSISSSTTYPSVGYTGRLQNDPPGTMDTETVLVAGGGYQGAVNRWGDYSAMHVDPDGCTFWYTQEYVAAPGGDWEWYTHVGSFIMPGCTPQGTGTADGTVTDLGTGLPIAGARVDIGTYTNYTQADGTYAMVVPADTYDITFSAFGYLPTTVPGVVVPDGGSVTTDAALTAAPSAEIDGYVTGDVHGWPLYAKIDVIAAGIGTVATTYTDPFSGYYLLTLPEGDYDFAVTAMIDGYGPGGGPVTVPPGGAIYSWQLPNDGTLGVRCILDPGIIEHFEGDFPPMGWIVTDDSGSGNVWMRNDEWGEINQTGGSGYSAHIDSDNAGSGAGRITTTMYSPFVQLPASPYKAIAFESDFRLYQAGEQAWFDISNDGGGSWTNLYYANASDRGQYLEFDLTAYAGQLVQFRWTYDDGGNWGWWWAIDDVQTYELPPPPPTPIAAEDFESWIPAGWTVIDNGGTIAPSDCLWESSATTGRTNYTPGSGYCADADADWCGSGTSMDTYLLSPVYDLSANPEVWLTFGYMYNNLSTSELAEVDITADGGMTWTNLVSWNSDQAADTYLQDVSSLVGGASMVQVRFYYYAPGWDWYFEIDDFALYAEDPTFVPPPEPTPTLECDPTGGALVAGFVTDGNTSDPINGATVSVDTGLSTTTMGTPDDPALADGFYYFYMAIPGMNAPSDRTFTAEKSGYGPDVEVVLLVPDAVNRIDFVLGAGLLEMTPLQFVSRLYPGDPNDLQLLSILNHGGLDAEVMLMALETTTWVPNFPMDEINGPAIPDGHANDLTSEAITLPTPEPSEVLAAGDVLQSWPSGLALPWGTGFNQFGSTVWVSNPGAGGGDDLDHEYATDGTPTGNTINTTAWMGSWAGDIAFDPMHGTLWQLAVGGDNCIHEIDLGTYAEVDSICWGATTSERGLAYDPISDTFFVGGWNTNAVTRFDRDGTVLQVANVGLGISGLAVNPSTGHLFVMVNADPNPVYVLDVNDNYNQLGTFSVAGFGAYAGAGMEFDCTGALWAANQLDGQIYQIDSGETGSCVDMGSLPWMTLTPSDGTVLADSGGVPGQLDVDVEFMVDGAYHFGLHTANIALVHDTPYSVPNAEVCFTKAFYDIPVGYWADGFIHSVAGVGVTTGCGAGNFCPSDIMTRGIMARWLLTAKYGTSYTPPPCMGIFGDVPCESTPNADYIEDLYNEGITGGCSADPLLFCPDDPVTRAQMAVFLLVTLEGAGYTPPACTGIFADVECTPTPYWAVNWIEEIYNRGITGGCGGGNYCPDVDIPRDQMAVFMTVAWDFPTCN